jgi:hypothetical protein
MQQPLSKSTSSSPRKTYFNYTYIQPVTIHNRHQTLTTQKTIPNHQKEKHTHIQPITFYV